MDEKLLEIEYGIRKQLRQGRLIGEKPSENMVIDPFDEKYSSLGKQDEYLQKELAERIRKRTLANILN